jgi:glycosyltransferase involved in cell wall biosynthesis
MKVLHLTLSFERGGRRRAITTLAEELRALDVTCDLCCLNQLGCPREEALRTFGRVEVLRRRSLLDRTALIRLTRLCDQEDVTLLHAHDAASQFTAALLRQWRPRLPLVKTFHRSLNSDTARLCHRLRNALACAYSGAIIIASRERCAHFLSENYVQPWKVVRIPLGIDLARFWPDPTDGAAIRRQLGLATDTVVLGAVGHFGHPKGLDVVLRGFRELARRRPPGSVALVVVGDGRPEQRALLHALAEQVAPQRVILTGYVPEVERWFRAFDLFVHAPRVESFGLVLPEAMASRLPVVATRVGGIPDIVRAGRTGFLVPPDAPVLLADALERLVRDPGLRDVLGAEARRVALAEYGSALYARRHLRLYEDVLAGRLPRGVDEEPEPAGADLPVRASPVEHSISF